MLTVKIKIMVLTVMEKFWIQYTNKYLTNRTIFLNKFIIS